MRVQPGDERLVAGSSGAALHAGGDRHRGQRHRHRHRAGEAAADLRGVPAGGRRHQPQVRRHRPRPGDQPRAGDAARRRDPAGERARRRAARSRCTCRSPTPARREPSRRCRRDARHMAATPSRCRCSRWRRPKRSCRTIATTSGEGDNVLLIVDDDPHYARVLLGLARDKGFKGIVANRGAGGADAGAPVPADRDHARRVPARHARLDGAQQPQARSGDAAHPGADAVGRGGAAARPVARRVLVPGQAGDDRGSRARVRPHQDLRRAAQEAAAGRRGQRHRARRASSSC